MYTQLDFYINAIDSNYVFGTTLCSIINYLGLLRDNHYIPTHHRSLRQIGGTPSIGVLRGE